MAAITDCDEFGRATRCYVSGYARDRVHDARISRGEKRCLVANFNGAMPADRAIQSVTWRARCTDVAMMANARIIGREVGVDLTAQCSGIAPIKCYVTLDNGEVMTQGFRVEVQCGPWFDDGQGTVIGPQELTASA